MTLGDARRDFVKSVLKDIGISCLLTAVIAFAIDRLSGHEITILWWLGTGLTSILIAYVVNLVTLYSNLSEHKLYAEYTALNKRHPGLAGLTFAWMLREINTIDARINLLENGGETNWTEARRIEGVTSLLEDLDFVPCYLATSTDAPYASCDATEAFYQAQRRKLRDADARRLLVFPLRELINGLRDPNNRRKTERFLSLHKEPISVEGLRVKSSFQLRYLPSETLATLRSEFINVTRDPDPPVDMAVIGDSLVFGQGAEDGAERTFPAHGKAFIFSGKAKALDYKRAFENIWSNWKDRVYPPAQLQAWIQLCEIRETLQHNLNGDSTVPPSGCAFFQAVLDRIKTSDELRAVDVADETKKWFEREEYKAFHAASCEAARSYKNGKHARVFVLRSPLDVCIASAFLEETLFPEVEAGIKVYVAYADRLVDTNIAAVDCIFGKDWGFYLTPIDNFDMHQVSCAQNWMSKYAVAGYFKQMFESLIKRSGAKRVDMSDLSDQVIIRKYLTGGV